MIRRGRVATALAGAVVIVAAAVVIARPWERQACPPVAEYPANWSVARRWDEALLDAIRRALPNPPVHARNLFHLSVAMWDAWATYEPSATGVMFKEKHQAADVIAARTQAISYAAYRVLSARFIKAVGADASLSQFDAVMDGLCLSPAIATADGDTPAAIGNRIASQLLAAAKDDGSNEANGYAAPDYKPVNPPLVVAKSGITITDPNRWQPLQLEKMISQNGIPVTNGVQQAVGPHWGHVTPFAIPAGGASGTPFDPGGPPRFGEDAYRTQAVEVIRDSSLLDPASPATIDVSPGARGANQLGTNDGHGRAQNPTTRAPYAPNVLRQADFYRALTEFWADGPNSETPPGHWNVVANTASDRLAPNLRIGGAGPVVDRLQWDVKLYLALNGAVHDAAIAAWGLKGHYDSVRPISMIRYLASLGQSSDPAQPAFNKDGLPLVPDLIAVITRQTTAPGGPMNGLAGHEGEIAIRAWQGNPPLPKTQVSPVSWMLGTAWVPYQLPTFVTPSFPGYVSGHSTFSRAAAEVLTGITGSEYFPDGLATNVVKAGTFRVEAGPEKDVVLQWATYYDAADAAGQSRLFGGIHVVADDFAGRVIGSSCGKDAWALAQRYYSGR